MLISQQLSPHVLVQCLVLGTVELGLELRALGSVRGGLLFLELSETLIAFQFRLCALNKHLSRPETLCKLLGLSFVRAELAFELIIDPRKLFDLLCLLLVKFYLAFKLLFKGKD
jgi:hypothetical protein